MPWVGGLIGARSRGTVGHTRNGLSHARAAQEPNTHPDVAVVLLRGQIQPSWSTFADPACPRPVHRKRTLLRALDLHLQCRGDPDPPAVSCQGSGNPDQRCHWLIATNDRCPQHHYRFVDGRDEEHRHECSHRCSGPRNCSACRRTFRDRRGRPPGEGGRAAGSACHATALRRTRLTANAAGAVKGAMALEKRNFWHGGADLGA